jgi:hypothetical protein
MNCRRNEEKVFPSLFEELDGGFVEARLHTDGDRGDELTAFEEEIAHSIATPLYLVLDPETERVLAGPLGIVVGADDFREFLEGAEKAAEGTKVGQLERR